MRGSESRRHRRYEVENVEGSFLFNLGVNIVNLSLAGMAVETHHQLRVGKCYPFKIDRESEQLQVRGTVAWCVLRRTERNGRGEVVPIYNAGVHFEEPPPERLEGLERFIEQNVILDVASPVSGRFRLGQQAKVELDDIVPFKVRKISLSGMLAETRLEAALESVLPVEISLANGLFAAEGRVAYLCPVQGLAADDTFHLGIEFLDIGNASKIRLEEYIAFLVASDELDPR
jgi:hypothetical protein